MKVDLIQSMGSDETVARAARVSTGKDLLDQGKIEGLINYLVREGHSSTLEHCVLTFRFEVPIFVHRQIMTHRTLSKNSESGRYTELKPHFYIPDAGRPLINKGTSAAPVLTHSEDGDLLEKVEGDNEYVSWMSWALYQDLLGAGVAKEVARNVLPLNTYTSMWATGNLLGWFNFLRLRNGTHGHPQYEIQEVAKGVEAHIKDLYPLTYEAWKKTMPQEMTEDRA